MLMILFKLNLFNLLKVPTNRPVIISSFSRVSRSLSSWIWASALRNASSPNQAFYLYSQMHRYGVPFDSFCIVFTLKSCTSLQNLSLIRPLHAHALKLGIGSHVYVATSLLSAYSATSFRDALILFEEMPERNTVTWNTMITGYSRSGDIEKARLVFDQMPLRNVESWSAMIDSYMGCGNYEQGSSLFRDMMVNGEGLKPDRVTVGIVLSGCAHMGSLGFLAGKSIHCFMVKHGLELTVELGTALVDMYAKCGFLKNATLVFELMRERNVMTWTALICGSSQHGYSNEALALFDMMQEAGVKPNEFTFTGVLNACAHAGLVNEGHRYFKMIEECGLKPRIQHYGCMVDLLGKAGMLEEAYETIKTMTIKPNIVVWSSFLSACKMHKKVQMAERVIELVLVTVKPENDGGVYALVSDLYVLGGKWNEAENLRKLMLNQNVRKVRGSSFIR